MDGVLLNLENVPTTYATSQTWTDAGKNRSAELSIEQAFQKIKLYSQSSVADMLHLPQIMPRQRNAAYHNFPDLCSLNRVSCPTAPSLATNVLIP